MYSSGPAATGGADSVDGPSQRFRFVANPYEPLHSMISQLLMQACTMQCFLYATRQPPRTILTENRHL